MEKHLIQMNYQSPQEIIANYVENNITYYSDVDEINNEYNQRVISNENYLRNFMREFPDRFKWSDVAYFEVSEEFSREFQYREDWEPIHYNTLLSEEFLREFSDRIDWSKVCYANLSEEFIREFQDHVDWSQVSMVCYQYSHSFMREFQNRIEWDDLYLDYRTEEFLREFQDRINWNNIIVGYLSEEFLREFSDRIDWSKLDYKNLSEEFLITFQDLVDWDILSSKYGIYKDDIIKPEECTYPIIENHDDLCGICRDQEGVMHQLPCKHAFHGDCIMSWLKRLTKKSCPMCRHVL